MTEVKIEKQNSAEALINETLKYISERENNINKYTDKLNKALGIINQAIDNLKISRDLYFEDTCPFYVNSVAYEKAMNTVTEKGYLIIENGYLKLKFIQQESLSHYTACKVWHIYQVSRKERKALITSKRLTAFLKIVAAKLEETEKEYKDAAEIAEKMASAIQ